MSFVLQAYRHIRLLAVDVPKPHRNSTISQRNHRYATFYPTWDEFKNLHKFIESLIVCGAQDVGLAKFVPPPEFNHQGKYNKQIGEMDIPNPMQQNFTRLEHGIFKTGMSMGRESIKVKELKKMSEERNFANPALDTNEDFERKYWKTLYRMYFRPVYGADVSGSLIDDSLEIW